MANETTKNGQFIELDYVAKIKQSDSVFDTSIKEEAKKAGLPEDKIKPLILCIGEGMVLKGLDKELEGKEVGKEYSVSLPPKDAFGNRNPKLIKILPINVFRSKGVNPYPGLVLNMDNTIARISAVSGGRVITDFNNPLSGKDVEYKFTIRKIINEDKEKLKCLAAYFLKANPEETVKEIKDGKAVIESKVKWPKKLIDEVTERMNKLIGLKIEIKTL